MTLTLVYLVGLLLHVLWWRRMRRRHPSLRALGWYPIAPILLAWPLVVACVAGAYAGHGLHEFYAA